MATRGRRAASGSETWAGFVDALSTLLVVLIFALAVFMIAQFFQGIAISGRDEALARLQDRIAELADLLALEKQGNADLRVEIAGLSADLRQATVAHDDAAQALALLAQERDSLIARLASVQEQVRRDEETLGETRSRMGLLREDLERALQDVAVTKNTLSLKLAEHASLQRDIDALQSVRDALEADVGRMLLLLDEARRRQVGLESELAQSQETGAALRDTLESSRGDVERLAGLLAHTREEREVAERALSLSAEEVASQRARIDALIASLAAARDRSMELEARLSDETERTLLAQREVAARDVRLSELAALVTLTQEERRAAEDISDRRARQIALINQQLQALRTQLAMLNAALEAAEAQAEESQVQIADLGARLNAALAAKVQELSRYRSDFLARLSEVLGDKPFIRVVGDRFVLLSELLFESGSADVSGPGKAELNKVADLIGQLNEEIPPQVDWVLRVDGHTDTVPIETPLFRTNWELSTARATAVVRHLVELGIPPRRLMAAGFGEFRPVDRSGDVISMQKNRRIEFKLTEP